MTSFQLRRHVVLVIDLAVFKPARKLLFGILCINVLFSYFDITRTSLVSVLSVKRTFVHALCLRII